MLRKVSKRHHAARSTRRSRIWPTLMSYRYLNDGNMKNGDMKSGDIKNGDMKNGDMKN